MKIQRKTSFFTHKRVTVLVAAVIVLFVAGSVYWWLYMRPKPVANDQRPINSVDSGPATPAEKQDSANAKKQAVDNAENPPAPSGNIFVSISRAGQVGADVSVRTVISGATEGGCTATFTKTGQAAVKKTFQITSQATAYVCNGDVPVGDFPAGGDWQLSLVATSSNSTSPAATETVTVKK